MNSIESLHVYPMTGAKGREQKGVRTNRAGGFDNDRTLVLYSQGSEGNERVSCKQFPKLLMVYIDGAGRIINPSEFTLSPNQLETRTGKKIVINEFGDKTEGVDTGDYAAGLFSDLLGSDVRLAYVSAQNRARIPRSARKVAPLHIVSRASIEWVADKTDISFEEARDRFRPNIVVSTDGEPFEENSWLSLDIGELGNTMRTHRPTARCAVPGYDTATGENLKDIPKLYHRDFPKAVVQDRQQPVFGMYGYIADPVSMSSVSVGQLVQPFTH